MAHFAKIENNQITWILAVANEAINNAPFPESEPLGQAVLAESGFDGEWLQCSYNGNFRGAYPGQGWAYDANLDEFIPPTIEEVTP